eukprot:scaffold137_cov398-Prasinococcus_capsulatus_cf.AAC.5
MPNVPLHQHAWVSSSDTFDVSALSLQVYGETPTRTSMWVGGTNRYNTLDPSLETMYESGQASPPRLQGWGLQTSLAIPVGLLTMVHHCLVAAWISWPSSCLRPYLHPSLCPSARRHTSSAA